MTYLNGKGKREEDKTNGKLLIPTILSFRRVYYFRFKFRGWSWSSDAAGYIQRWAESRANAYYDCSRYERGLFGQSFLPLSGKQFVVYCVKEPLNPKQPTKKSGPKTTIIP